MPPHEPLLTSEAALADPARSAAIDGFWDEVGQFGHFTGNGGLALACAVFRQPDPACERGAVLVVNGRTESLLKYREVAYDLWQNGYSVYLYDHRGQGLSEREAAVAAPDTRERGHVERFDDYVDDLLTFIRTHVIPARHAVHHLLAHSMGSAVSALMLERAGPEQTLFRAAALASPMLSLMGVAGRPVGAATCGIAHAAKALGFGSRPVTPSGGYLAAPFDGNPFTRSAIRYARWRRAFEQAPAVRLGVPTFAWLGAACEAIERARRDAWRIQVPVLALVAGADAIVHPSGTDAFWAGLTGTPASRPGLAHARMTIEDARHELLIENDAARDRALGAALRFFSEHAGAAPVGRPVEALDRDGVSPARVRPLGAASRTPSRRVRS